MPMTQEERASAIHDIRDLMAVSWGLDAEHKRLFLEDAQVFTPEELDRLSQLSDKDLGNELKRLENFARLTTQRN